MVVPSIPAKLAMHQGLEPAPPLNNIAKKHYSTKLLLDLTPPLPSPKLSNELQHYLLPPLLHPERPSPSLPHPTQNPATSHHHQKTPPSHLIHPICFRLPPIPWWPSLLTIGRRPTRHPIPMNPTSLKWPRLAPCSHHPTLNSQITSTHCPLPSPDAVHRSYTHPPLPTKISRLPPPTPNAMAFHPLTTSMGCIPQLNPLPCSLKTVLSRSC